VNKFLGGVSMVGTPGLVGSVEKNMKSKLHTNEEGRNIQSEIEMVASLGSVALR
jgi:hypothetical protein